MLARLSLRLSVLLCVCLCVCLSVFPSVCIPACLCVQGVTRSNPGLRYKFWKEDLMKQLVRMGLVMLEQGNTHALWITMQVLNKLHMGMCTFTLSLFGAIFGLSVLFTVVCMCERRTAKGWSVRCDSPLPVIQVSRYSVSSYTHISHTDVGSLCKRTQRRNERFQTCYSP